MFTSPTIAKIIEECEAFIATKDDAWSIDRPSAILLHQIATLRNAKNILEIGMSYGHSGLFLADAAARNAGHFTTVEANDKKIPIARDYFERAGLQKHVSILHGRAPEILSQVDPKNGPVDFLFVDATKQEQTAYLDVLWQKLAPRAVIITDNITSHPTEVVDYLKRLRTDPKLSSSLIPIGNGLELTVKLA